MRPDFNPGSSTAMKKARAIGAGFCFVGLLVNARAFDVLGGFHDGFRQGRVGMNRVHQLVNR